MVALFVWTFSFLCFLKRSGSIYIHTYPLGWVAVFYYTIDIVSCLKIVQFDENLVEAECIPNCIKLSCSLNNSEFLYESQEVSYILIKVFFKLSRCELIILTVKQIEIYKGCAWIQIKENSFQQQWPSPTPPSPPVFLSNQNKATRLFN